MTEARGSPNQQAAAGARGIAEGDKRRDDGGKQEAIDAVEQATMTGDEVTRILGSEAPLHGALEQITHLAREREHDAHQRKLHRRCLLERPGESITDESGGEGANDKPAPGLLRRDSRRELGSTKQAPGGIRGGVRGPGYNKKIKRGGAPPNGVAAEKQERRGRQGRISETGERPDAP